MRKPHRVIPPLTSQDLARFWVKVDIRGSDECWSWQAQQDRDGYGRFRLGSWTDGSAYLFLAHRVAWTIAYGPIPAGMCVLHHCDNPPCCNPACLFLGTDADNAHDRDRKGRNNSARGGRHGSRTHPECLARGEAHWKAKLTGRDVRDIRRRYAASGVTICALAHEYGVGKSQISAIIRYESWAHVRKPELKAKE